MQWRRSYVIFGIAVLVVVVIAGLFIFLSNKNVGDECPYSVINDEYYLETLLENNPFNIKDVYTLESQYSSMDQFGILPPQTGGYTDCQNVPESEPVCNSSYPYRKHDGSCNNLEHPTWGMAGECQLRLLPAAYEGEDEYRKSVSGKPLPAARDLNINVLPDVDHPSRVLSHMAVMLGQAVAHDVMATPTPTKNLDFCCPYNERNRARKECAPIFLKSDDPFYSQYNTTCLSFERTNKCTQCNQTGEIQKVNKATAALDLSLVYGTSDEQAEELRLKDGTGRLKFEAANNVQLLPRNIGNFSLFCRKNQTSECFLSGDSRVDVHATLTALQTVFLRDHNRLAERLKELNPHWEEETLYQEARKISIGKWQNMVYAEYLPSILGPRHMTHFGLWVGQNGTRYNASTRLGIFLEVSTAGFRLHSQTASKLGVSELKFIDTYSKPDLIRKGCAGTLLKGASSVPSQEFDGFSADDIRNVFFLRLDLTSMDIWRGRDNGMPPYVDMVEYLTGGLTKVASFDDLNVIMPQQSIDLLKKYYDSVSDVDLWMGLQLESHSRGSGVGFNSATLSALQFHYLKYGDRFYFEHGGEEVSFTTDQLASIRNSSLSRLLCDNTDIENIQVNSLLLSGPQNPIVNCDAIVQLDLRPWKTDV